MNVWKQSLYLAEGQLSLSLYPLDSSSPAESLLRSEKLTAKRTWNKFSRLDEKDDRVGLEYTHAAVLKTRPKCKY